MKFKKITALAVTVMMAAGILVGCGGSQGGEDEIVNLKW